VSWPSTRYGPTTSAQQPGRAAATRNSRATGRLSTAVSHQSGRGRTAARPRARRLRVDARRPLPRPALDDCGPVPERDIHHRARREDEEARDAHVRFARCCRVSCISLVRGVLRISRDALRFLQRFTGHVRASGKTIEGQWEAKKKSHWEHDFDITYVRVSRRRIRS
jgi:hypothetical protein